MRLMSVLPARVSSPMTRSTRMNATLPAAAVRMAGGDSYVPPAPFELPVDLVKQIKASPKALYFQTSDAVLSIKHEGAHKAGTNHSFHVTMLAKDAKSAKAFNLKLIWAPEERSETRYTAYWGKDIRADKELKAPEREPWVPHMVTILTQGQPMDGSDYMDVTDQYADE